LISAQVISHRFEATSQLPSLSSVKASEAAKPIGSPSTGRPDFLKTLQIDSFGVSRSSQAGVNDSLQLKPTSDFEHGLECGFCVTRPVWARAKSSLPAFGTQVGVPVFTDRVQLLTGFGGIDASRPDDVMTTGFFGKPSRYDNNDNWLLQGSAGMKFFLDREHRVSLGGLASYVESLGDKYQFGSARPQWKTYKGSVGMDFHTLGMIGRKVHSIASPKRAPDSESQQ
jgi:hypothetical protein